MISSNVAVWTLITGFLFCLKHFFADGPFQSAYQYKNKGDWKHPGGYLHAGIHGLFTAVIFAFVGFWWLGIFDAVVHWATDYTKVNATKSFEWAKMGSTLVSRRTLDGNYVKTTSVECLCITSDFYFYALIADQCVHFMTYVTMIVFVLSMVK